MPDHILHTSLLIRHRLPLPLPPPHRGRGWEAAGPPQGVTRKRGCSPVIRHQCNWGFYKDCEILTFPVLFHARTRQSAGTTVSTVSTVRPVRAVYVGGSCRGRFRRGGGRVQAALRTQRVPRVSGVGLGYTHRGGGSPPSKSAPCWENALESPLDFGKC